MPCFRPIRIPPPPLIEGFCVCVAPGDTCVELCAVGDSGLKTGWVRGGHGAGGGGGGVEGFVAHIFILSSRNRASMACIANKFRDY